MFRNSNVALFMVEALMQDYLARLDHLAGFLRGLCRVRQDHRTHDLPCGNRVFLDPLQPGGHPRPVEIFLREHVRRDLAPGGGNLDAVLRENNRTVRIADFAFGRPERDFRVGGVFRLAGPLGPPLIWLDAGSPRSMNRANLTATNCRIYSSSLNCGRCQAAVLRSGHNAV